MELRNKFFCKVMLFAVCATVSLAGWSLPLWEKQGASNQDVSGTFNIGTSSVVSSLESDETMVAAYSTSDCSGPELGIAYTAQTTPSTSYTFQKNTTVKASAASIYLLVQQIPAIDPANDVRSVIIAPEKINQPGNFIFADPNTCFAETCNNATHVCISSDTQNVTLNDN